MMTNHKLGLVGLGALAMVAALVVAASGLAIGSRHYTAVLKHTAGLRVGEEVQVAGVGVGEVTAITLGDGEVEVEFTLDDAVRLGDRSTAEVKVATLLGTHFLMVSPRGGGELPDDTIPVDRTRVPFNLQDVINAGTDEIGRVDARAVERSLAELGKVLGRSGDDLGPALDGVRQLSGLVQTRSDEMGRLLVAARTVSRQLENSTGDVVEMMRQADVILDALRARRETIHALLRDLATFGDQLTGVVRDNRADLAPMMRDIRTVTEVLEKHDGALSHALSLLGPTARYFGNGSGTGPWLDQYTDGGTPDNLRCQEERSC